MTDECPCFMDSSGKIVHLPNCTKVENGGDSSTCSKHANVVPKEGCYVCDEPSDESSQSTENTLEPPKPEPDAWVWNKYVLNKTSSVSVTTVDKPRTVAENLVKEGEIEDISKINKVPESEERLFSAETIQKTIQDIIRFFDERIENELEIQENAYQDSWEEKSSIVACNNYKLAKEKLEELEKVFTQE